MDACFLLLPHVHLLDMAGPVPAIHESSELQGAFFRTHFNLSALPQRKRVLRHSFGENAPMPSECGTGPLLRRGRVGQLIAGEQIAPHHVCAMNDRAGQTESTAGTS